MLDKNGTFTDKIPDHSVIEFYFLPDYTGIENNIDISAASNLQNVTDRPQSNNDETTQRYFRRYNVRNKLADFLKSDVAQQAFVYCIDSILLTTERQDEIICTFMYAIYTTVKWITGSDQIT